MILIPKPVYAQYLQLLQKNNVDDAIFSEYVKWLRYYLDFCAKHLITNDPSERLRLFLEKLREKKQSDDQCHRAAHAISLYLKLQPRESPSIRNAPDAILPEPPSESPPSQKKSQYIDAGYQVTTDSPEWDKVMETMTEEIKVRHYSRKTLKTYAKWSRCFQRFLKNKPPEELSTADVKEYHQREGWGERWFSWGGSWATPPTLSLPHDGGRGRCAGYCARFRWLCLFLHDYPLKLLGMDKFVEGGKRRF